MGGARDPFAVLEFGRSRVKAYRRELRIEGQAVILKAAGTLRNRRDV